MLHYFTPSFYSDVIPFYFEAEKLSAVDERLCDHLGRWAAGQNSWSHQIFEKILDEIKKHVD